MCRLDVCRLDVCRLDVCRLDVCRLDVGPFDVEPVEPTISTCAGSTLDVCSQVESHLEMQSSVLEMSHEMRHPRAHEHTFDSRAGTNKRSTAGEQTFDAPQGERTFDMSRR